jgi:hypothetical protein
LGEGHDKLNRKNGEPMFFKKRKQKDVPAIVRALASLGLNRDGKSMFLENEDIASDTVAGFVQKCRLSRDRFNVAENILRLTNVCNASVVFLNLKDKSLEESICKGLRDPGLFLDVYPLEPGLSPKEVEIRMVFVDRGFSLLMDNLFLSQKEITIGAHEMLAARFMNFLSDGNLGTEDDRETWLALGFAIYQDLSRLPEEIAKVKKKLDLN